MWRAGLHVERHVLVLGRRGRGLCVLVVLHRAGVLADTQVGKPCPHAPQRQISDTDSLCDRHLYSRAPAQPAVYPRHRSGHLLPSVERHHRDRFARGTRPLGRSGGSDTLRTRARIHRSVAVFRALLCQRGRSELQHRCAHLCHPHCGLVHMGHQRALQAEQREPSALERGPQHPAFGHPLHRQQHVDTRHHHGWPAGLSVLGQEAPGENPQHRCDEHLCHLHRLLELRAAAHTLVGQSADEPERARQCVCPRLLPQPRAVWRTPALLWPDQQLVGGL